MTDELELHLAAKEKAKAHQAKVKRMRAAWERAGYDPRGHLALIAGAEGDHEVLELFSHREGGGTAGSLRTVGSLLASWDLVELHNATWSFWRTQRATA
jgi:hypothetical protein